MAGAPETRYVAEDVEIRADSDLNILSLGAGRLRYSIQADQESCRKALHTVLTKQGQGTYNKIRSLHCPSIANTIYRILLYVLLELAQRDQFNLVLVMQRWTKAYGITEDAQRPLYRQGPLYLDCQVYITTLRVLR